MSRVCVTGATGYIAPRLVLKLLQRGCVVHATLRSLCKFTYSLVDSLWLQPAIIGSVGDVWRGNEKKTGLLRLLPGAAERLVLFEADIYDAASFEPAIQGCEFVFLIATPLLQDTSSTSAASSSSSSPTASSGRPLIRLQRIHPPASSASVGPSRRSRCGSLVWPGLSPSRGGAPHRSPSPATTVAGDDRRLPFESSSVHFVFAGHALDSSKRPSDLAGEAVQILKLEGHLVMLTSSVGDAYNLRSLQALCPSLRLERKRERNLIRGPHPGQNRR
nr:uncharacterized protein LOC109784013 [Aegilops tauschii subsp. strangulata]